MIPKVLPFYFGTHSDPGNGGFPETLPFDVYWDQEFAMFRQRCSPELTRLLDQVYQNGSLVEGSTSNQSGAEYLTAMVREIQLACPDLEGRRVLEIGCGSGALLRKLVPTGAELHGIDPGTQTGAPDDRVSIVRGFFPHPDLGEGYDLIYHFAVLEHVEDPVAFLAEQRRRLRPSGTLMVAVPNCGPFLELGDISIFIHEHVNYFTEASLRRVMARSGFEVEWVRPMAGMLLAKANPANVGELPDAPGDGADAFAVAASKLQGRLWNLLSEWPGEQLAAYVPGRALNYLYLRGDTDRRLTDDSPELHNRFFPCLKRPVESFASLASNPPSAVLVFSLTFGPRLRERCHQEPRLNRTRVLALSELVPG